jgi:hypothetical protein
LFRPPDGTVFTLIANDGVDPISGIFFDAGGNPLGEGATLRFGGIEATISYSGGAGGNDVTLTVTDAINFRTQLLSDASGAGTFFAANALGGGGAAVEQPKLTAPPLLAPSTAPVSSQAFEVVVKETEFRTTERLRVYFRIVNDATGEEEKEEFALDPSVLRDLLGIFKRFKFRDHHYRIYLQEPGKSERLILDVYILDGRVVPANFRETEGQNTQPAKPDANQAAPSDSTPAESPASAPQAPAGETPPDEATGQSPAGAQQGHPETTTADRSPAQTTDPPGTQGVEFQIPASPPTNDGAMHTAPSHTSAARWITAAAASGAVLSTTATASNWREQVRELLAGKEMPLGKTARLLRRARRD